MKLSENLNTRLNERYYRDGYRVYCADVFWYGVAEFLRRIGL